MQPYFLKQIILLTCIFFFSPQIMAQMEAWQWAKSGIGGASDRATGIAVDAKGNSYVCGSFQSFSLGLGSKFLYNSDSGSSDIFIAKYDPNGTLLWAKSSGGIGYDAATSITLDNQNKLYVTGYYQSKKLIFGKDTLTNTDASGQSNDIFVVKLDGNGNTLWTFGTGSLSNEVANGISTDLTGNVYITGNFSGNTITFGGISLKNSGAEDIFIAKLDANANVKWAKNPKGNLSDFANGINVSELGKVLITGYYLSDELDFDGKAITGYRFDDAYVACYDSLGTILWANAAGGGDEELGSSVTSDRFGNVYVCGTYTSDSIQFDHIKLGNVAPGSNDMFLVKYNITGKVLWAKNAVSPAYERANAVFTDKYGNVHLTGFFTGDSVWFDTKLLSNKIAGTASLFIVKYDSTGVIDWAHSEGGQSGVDAGTCAAIDTLGNLFLAGYFSSKTFSLGSTVLKNNAGPNSSDFFIGRAGSKKVSISQLSKPQFKVYPNPGNGNFVLQSAWMMDRVEITNCLGQSIYISNTRQVQTDIKLNEPGLYYLTVYFGTSRETVKILVQK